MYLNYIFISSPPNVGQGLPSPIFYEKAFWGACLSDKAMALLTVGRDEGKDSWGLEWVGIGRMSASRRGFLLYKVDGPHSLREMSLLAGRNLYRQNLECFSGWEFEKWFPKHRNSLSSGLLVYFHPWQALSLHTGLKTFFCPLVWFCDNTSCLPN